MNDVIIVGGGIAGTTLAWQWHLKGKSIYWITDGAAASSHVAAGVFNPVVLKRFSPVWMAQEQVNFMLPFYKEVEKYLDQPVITYIPIWRRLHDEKERATWIRKSAREDLSSFMNSEPIDSSINGVSAPHGFGEVNPTGWLDTQRYMKESVAYFSARGEFNSSGFDHSRLEVKEDHITYEYKKARHIIFAEGIRISENPWFRDLPLQGNKGEILIIKCPGLVLKQIVKSSIFLMPYKADMFWVGATYDRDYMDDLPSSEARDYLISRLDTIVQLPYQIIDHKSGIRPTTMDRRPFVGTHKLHKNMHVVNGMGSRASLVSPWASSLLCASIYEQSKLPEEMDIARFDL